MQQLNHTLWPQNDQPAETVEHRQRGGQLDVHSIYPTIQGEGPFAGQRAIFVRLAGCNLQCPLCDVDYTSSRKQLSPLQILAKIDELMMRAESPYSAVGYLVVLTGGEPFRQQLLPLIEAVLNAGYRVQIETNGTLYQPLPYGRITVVCSPKTGAINKQLLPYISSLKYVASCDSMGAADGLPLTALGLPTSPLLARPPLGFRGPVYLQPADVKDPDENRFNLDAVLLSAANHGYIVSLQLQKIMGVQ